jgi:hypothetical protein
LIEILNSSLFLVPSPTIRECTMSLRFLGIILRVLSPVVGFCMDFLNHREGGVIRFSSFHPLHCVVTEQ